jgi:hypothetical protein
MGLISGIISPFSDGEGDSPFEEQKNLLDFENMSKIEVHNADDLNHKLIDICLEINEKLSKCSDGERPLKDSYIVLKNVQIQPIGVHTSLPLESLVLFIDQIIGTYIEIPRNLVAGEWGYWWGWAASFWGRPIPKEDGSCAPMFQSDA